MRVRLLRLFMLFCYDPKRGGIQQWYITSVSSGSCATIPNDDSPASGTGLACIGGFLAWGWALGLLAGTAGMCGFLAGTAGTAGTIPDTGFLAAMPATNQSYMARAFIF